MSDKAVQCKEPFQFMCFSPNAFSNWCASIALSHCLKDNAVQKEQLLRVQLATSVGKS